MSLFSQFHQYLDLTCSPESCQCGIRSYSQSSIVPSRLPSTITSSTAGAYPLNLKVFLENVHGHRTIHSTSRTHGKRKKMKKKTEVEHISLAHLLQLTSFLNARQRSKPVAPKEAVASNPQRPHQHKPNLLLPCSHSTSEKEVYLGAVHHPTLLLQLSILVAPPPPSPLFPVISCAPTTLPL